MSDLTEDGGNYYMTLNDDSKVQQWITLLYGASGVGKTLLAAHWPDPLFLSCERGMYGGSISAKHLNPKVVKINTYQDYVNVLPKLEQGAGTEFKTLILDSVTAFQKLIMDNILQEKMREKPQFDEWGLSTARVRTAINKLANMNCHVIFIATENVIVDEHTQRTMGLPNVPGKMAHELPANVDLVLHMSVQSGYNEKGERELSYLIDSTPDEVWKGKDCSGTLPSRMSTPQGKSAFQHLKHLFEDKG